MYLCACYELFKGNIRPTLGGAFAAFPSQLQSTISVCLAVRIPIDSHIRWAIRKQIKFQYKIIETAIVQFHVFMI